MLRRAIMALSNPTLALSLTIYLSPNDTFGSERSVALAPMRTPTRRVCAREVALIATRSVSMRSNLFMVQYRCEIGTICARGVVPLCEFRALCGAFCRLLFANSKISPTFAYRFMWDSDSRRGVGVLNFLCRQNNCWI